jgi:hypothetical protein
MDDLTFPQSANELCARLKFLHEERKKLPRANRRLSLNKRQRAIVLDKTAGRCHLCGGAVEEKFAADHVLAHRAGGAHAIDNYLPAHGLCNGCKWFYSPEEFQWILRMGVWARKQMEDRTTIGKQMLVAFFKREQGTRKRRKVRKPK